MSIAMIVTSRAQSGKRDEVFNLWTSTLAPLAEKNGAQQVVVWCNDEQDPDTFHLFEIYESQEALGANAQNPAFADYMASAMPLLVGEPTVSMAAPTWSKGLV